MSYAIFPVVAPCISSALELLCSPPGCFSSSFYVSRYVLCTRGIHWGTGKTVQADFRACFLDDFGQISVEGPGFHTKLICHLKALTFGSLEPKKAKDLGEKQGRHTHLNETRTIFT